ncbi:hypothetical protein HDU93_001920 [Gonapodya sp. JEL0774]|nr:hypothetical protein HDU93_001920 [Gonapodya sp. JEL0774]
MTSQSTSRADRKFSRHPVNDTSACTPSRFEIVAFNLPSDLTEPIEIPTLASDNFEDPNVMTHSALNAANLLLLEAAEIGDVEGLEAALKAGAEPYARKVVTLRCLVFEEMKRSKKLLSDEVVLKGVGRSENRYLTWNAESALALAIIFNHTDCVATLLQGRADPNLPVSWSVVRGRPIWVQDEWNQLSVGQYDLTYRFDSALALALGWGDSFERDGTSVQIIGEEERQGQLVLNKRGAVIRLATPTNVQETVQLAKLSPNPDIVALLIKAGATVTDSHWDAARKLEDKDFPRFSAVLDACSLPRSPTSSSITLFTNMS